MNGRKIVMSVTLGAMLALVLLIGLSFNRSSAVASPERTEAIDQVSTKDAVQTQDDISTAHVVVQFSDGDRAVRPVMWTGTISRVSALKNAGFVVEHTGDTVCSIDGNGCPVTDCFCADNLWAQGQWAGTAWDTSSWPPPNLTHHDVIAFRNGTQPDYSDWGLVGFLPGASTFVAASDALEWMRDQQQSNGSYPSWAGPIAGSVRSLLALGSAGYDPDEWGSPSLLDFLTVVSKTETVDYAASGAAEAGRLALGAAWTDQTVTDFADINLPISITAYYSPTTGAYGDGSGDTAWAMLGLHAADEGIPTQAVDFLKGMQNDDGGWAWNEWGTTSEVQHTALCVQALLAAGEPVTSTALTDALAFIDSAENSDGGYGYMSGDASDLSTTVYVIQSLLSAGHDPVGNWCATIQCRYLLSKQEADGSLPGYSPLYSVQEAIPALMHRPYGPLAPWTYQCYANYLPMVTKSAIGEP